MLPTSLRGLALLCGVALTAVSACRTEVSPATAPGSGARSDTPGYAVLADPPSAGRKGTAQRRRFCQSWQCASAGDKAWCMDRCVNVWDFPTPRMATVPGPSRQRVYHFDSDHQGAPGVVGKVNLRLGKRTFRAHHTGSSNFIVYVTSVLPDSAPEVAFNEIGKGHWVWNYQVRRAGLYTVDIKAADGEWAIDIE